MVHVEITASNHTALYKLGTKERIGLSPSVPSPSGPNLLISIALDDLSHSRSNGSISVDPTTGRMTGSGIFRPGYGIGHYGAYFCADFTGAAIRETGIWKGSEMDNKSQSISVASDGYDSIPTGAYIRLDATADEPALQARVGVSFISEQRACDNAEEEAPASDFNALHQVASASWDDKLLAVSIEPKGVEQGLQTLFWSSLYRSMISPHDITGENALWSGDEPAYDSFYW